MANEPTRPTVSLSRYPGPCCTYTLNNGAARVEVANDVFTNLFDSDGGDELTTVFGTATFSPPEAGTNLANWLNAKDHFRIRFEEETAWFLAQPIPPGSNEPGVLLLTRTDGYPPARRAEALGVDHVASVVSHDLRNPLDVAQARLEAGRNLEEEKHLDHVERAHERMERIIQDVLTLARGEEVVEPAETVGLSDLAESAWDTVETTNATLRIEGPLPQVMADPDRTARLFENLFRNGLEHGRAGTDDHLTITVGAMGTDGMYVADDGTGIPSEDRPRVFEPGYTSEPHGTGLGLAIVARIVDLHGWTITIEDSAAGGAQFVIRGLDPAESSEPMDREAAKEDW